ncbi:MAG: hypothetical protein IPN14_10805 [Bacteroidetes bacterium]|nr:hypothetical protein [Bacteroidota bacterium]
MGAKYFLRKKHGLLFSNRKNRHIEWRDSDTLHTALNGMMRKDVVPYLENYLKKTTRRNLKQCRA